MLVSIIVPVYNVEHYLAECLDSILAQSYRELEVILVDDGSNDASGAICDAYAGQYGRIRVFHLVNGGVSRARNFGVEKASGEYIMFVDSDDIIMPYAVEHGVTLARIYEADVVYGLIQRTSDMSILADSQGETLLLSESKDLHGLQQHMFDLSNEKFWQDKMFINRGPYCRIIKISLAVSVKFQEGLALGEDSIWNLEILSNHPRCVVDFTPWYKYRINTASAVFRYRANCGEEFTKLLRAFMPYARTLSTQAHCFNKAWECICDMCRTYYLHAESHLSLVAAVLDLRALRQTYPWNEICSFSWASPLGLKGIVKLILIKTDMAVLFMYARHTTANWIKHMSTGGVQTSSLCYRLTQPSGIYGKVGAAV